MRRLLLILSLLCAFRAPLTARASYAFTNADNLTLILHGDSLWKDGDLNTASSPEQTGCMFPDYLASGVFGLNPDKTNLMVINLGKSGSKLTDQATAIAQLSYALFSYPLFHGYGTNSIHNIGLSQATENGQSTSNAMFLTYATNFLALAITTNSVAFTNEGGTSVSNHVDWVTISDPAAVALDGGGTGTPSDWLNMTAATNAGARFGAGFVNIYDRTFIPVTNWVGRGDSPPLEIKTGIKAGHYRALYELLMADAYWMETTTDTNVSNITIDYNTLAMSNTNHSVGFNASRSGNTLTFTEHPFRISPGWDIAGSVDLLGNVTTNDCSAFSQVWPAAGDFWQETITVTGLPVGNYKIYENGVFKALVSSAVLAAGWNIATNYAGPRWQQRVELLGRARDVENADRVSLLVSAGDGAVALGSLAFSKYPTFTGDALEAQLDSAITALKTNSTHSFAAMTAESQGQDFTYQIVPDLPRYVAAHR